MKLLTRSEKIYIKSVRLVTEAIMSIFNNNNNNIDLCVAHIPSRIEMFHHTATFESNNKRKSWLEGRFNNNKKMYLCERERNRRRKIIDYFGAINGISGRRFCLHNFSRFYIIARTGAKKHCVRLHCNTFCGYVKL